MSRIKLPLYSYPKKIVGILVDCGFKQYPWNDKWDILVYEQQFDEGTRIYLFREYETKENHWELIWFDLWADHQGGRLGITVTEETMKQCWEFFYEYYIDYINRR